MPRASGWWMAALLGGLMGGLPARPVMARVGASIEAFDSGQWVREHHLARTEARVLDRPGRQALRYRGRDTGEIWLVVQDGRIEAQIFALPLGEGPHVKENLDRLAAFLTESGLHTPPSRQVWDLILEALDGTPPVLETDDRAIAACRIEAPTPWLLVAIARDPRSLPFQPPSRQLRPPRSVSQPSPPATSSREARPLPGAVPSTSPQDG